MGAAEPLTRRGFGRRLFGYRKAEVDAYISAAAAANELLKTEVDRLHAAEPLTRIGDEVAALIVSFAETVASMREAAAEDAARTRRDAERYAEAQRAEADRLVLDAVDRARVVAGDVLTRARAEFAVFAEQGRAVERALEEASRGINVALEAMHRLQDLPQPVVAGTGTAAPSEVPSGDDAASQESTFRTSNGGVSMLGTATPDC